MYLNTQHKFEYLRRLLARLDELHDLPPDVAQLAVNVRADLCELLAGGEVHLVWRLADVLDAAAELDGTAASPLTDEEARGVLAAIERRHSADTGMHWGTVRGLIREALQQKRCDAEIAGAIQALSAAAKRLGEEHPHLEVTFGYIGNCSMGHGPKQYDDRSWRFFFARPGRPSQSFGGCATERLPWFASHIASQDGADALANFIRNCLPPPLAN